VVDENQRACLLPQVKEQPAEAGPLLGSNWLVVWLLLPQSLILLTLVVPTNHWVNGTNSSASCEIAASRMFAQNAGGVRRCPTALHYLLQQLGVVYVLQEDSLVPVVGQGDSVQRTTAE